MPVLLMIPFLVQTTLYSELFKLNDGASNDNLMYLQDAATNEQFESVEDNWDQRGTNIGPYESESYGVTTDAVELLSYPEYCGALMP
jgi:hypothetical protein